MTEKFYAHSGAGMGRQQFFWDISLHPVMLAPTRGTLAWPIHNSGVGQIQKYMGAVGLQSTLHVPRPDTLMCPHLSARLEVFFLLCSMVAACMEELDNSKFVFDKHQPE